MERLVIFAISDEISVADVEQARRHGESLVPQGDMSSMSLKDVEREQIVKVVREAGGNRSLAAKRLGIERKTLYMKARRLGIDLTS